MALAPDDYTMNVIWEAGTWGRVSVGGSATGVVEVPGDLDFFGVNLSRGRTYRIDVASEGNTDALENVRLHGVFIYAEELECSGAYEDPGVTTYVLTAGHSELYSVAVGAEGDGTGGYRVSVAESAATGSVSQPAPVAAAQAANTPATGAPAISGTARVGETLTVDTSGIADEDGLENAVFSYQWLAGGADISGATDSTYVPVVDDAGRTIGVRVSFTDDDGNEETLTGAAGTVPADDYTVNEVWETGNWGRVTVGGSATGVIEKPGDRDFFGVNLSRGRTYRIEVAGHGDVGALEQVRLYGVFVYAEDLECSGAYDDPGVTTYVLTAEHSAPHSVAVRAEGDGTGVYRVSVSESDDTGAGCDTAPAAEPQAANTPATGAPAITGTVRVGETLSADTSGIADEDGLDNVSFAYQWQADDAEISGATGSAYTLADADEGRAISVKVSFSDDAGNAETLTSEPTGAVEAKPNTPATGEPNINGTAQVGETLTADTSGIADADGLDNVSFTYQWLAGDADIQGATASTYTPVVDDMGKAISVRVSFTDDAGNAETLTSMATATVEARPNTAATGAPDISGTAQVGETLSADTSRITDADGLSNAAFAYQWRADGADISGATGATYTLVVDDMGKAISVRVSFTDDAGNVESLTSMATATVEARPNTAATGAPTISGTAQVGETLTADASGIADQDGLSNVAYSYQWLADGTDVLGATGSTYTLADADAGKIITVRVSFTDDAGNAETLISDASAEVAAGGEAAEPTDRPHGLTAAASPDGIVLTWRKPATEGYISDYRILRNRPELGEAEPLVYVDYTETRDTSFTDTEAESGVLYVYRVKAVVNFFGDVGEVSWPVEIRMAGTAQQQTPKTPATGRPIIGGTAQVGKNLTADTSGIADEDGLSNATFSYQWLADGADMSGATGSTYTLLDPDEGKTISVTVSFTDDAGNAETLTSAATGAVEVEAATEANIPATGAPTISGTAQVGQTLAADTSGIADADGLDNAAFAHQWMADGADIAGATGSTYTLGDADEGKAVSVKVSFSDDRGHQETLTSEPTEAVEARPNSPATGDPTINGTARVGETLAADTSAIADDDGLTNATFAYQWLADGVEISGATASSYTLADADEGKAISVTVSFTDDRGNEETLTSAATPAVEPKANIPATGAPTISGTVQVGETLTLDVSGIADEDGLDNAAFSYQWQADGADISGATDSSYTLAEADEGKAISVRMSFTDDAGNEETLTGAATVAAEARPNSPAMGAPTISGTTQVGETLTADVSGISDADGLTNVTFSYQWVVNEASDGATGASYTVVVAEDGSTTWVPNHGTADTDIEGATSPTYALTEADEGRPIRVRVSFTDDAGNAETVISAPTLTAGIHAAPSSHDGENVFTFELHFSEEFGISYKTLRDHAFTVTGGTVKKAQRLEQGSNIGWRITVSPDSSGAVTIILPITEDCEAQGAICTEDGRKLSHRLELAVSGPGQ